MFYRVIAAAACVLLLAGCQQAGPALNSTVGVTAPSSLSVKAVDVPFSGVVTGEAEFDFAANPKDCVLGFTTVTTARGTASHLGLTTWISQHCLGEDSTIVDAELVLISANGDEIHATYTGSCTGPEVIGDPVTCSVDVVFSGGTGRFVNASGTAELIATVIFEGFEDLSWPGRWEWKGSIRY